MNELTHDHTHTGPTDQYNHTLTTSQMYGWWMKDTHDSPQKKEWAQCERHAHVNSQMTRYKGIELTSLLSYNTNKLNCNQI